MDEKAMEREERFGRFIIGISDWWELQKSKISKFIYLDMLRYEKPQLVVERIQEQVQSWNSKYAGRCEACNHNELKTLYWLDDPNEGFKCFECTRCHHKQPRDNSKITLVELDKTRVVIMQKGASPRYMLLSPKQQIWLCIITIIGLLALSFYLGNFSIKPLK